MGVVQAGRQVQGRRCCRGWHARLAKRQNVWSSWVEEKSLGSNAEREKRVGQDRQGGKQALTSPWSPAPGPDTQQASPTRPPPPARESLSAHCSRQQAGAVHAAVVGEHAGNKATFSR